MHLHIEYFSPRKIPKNASKNGRHSRTPRNTCKDNNIRSYWYGRSVISINVIFYVILETLCVIEATTLIMFYERRMYYSEAEVLECFQDGGSKSSLNSDKFGAIAFDFVIINLHCVNCHKIILSWFFFMY